MTPVEHLSGIWALSGGFWLIYGFYISIRIERFIVKRYEEETDLLSTVFFREHATFTRSIPNFFSSAMYTSHLLMCLWGWWLYAGRKVFRDIEDPAFVIQKFSKKEIRWVKGFAVSCLVIAIHGMAYLIFSAIWPKEFS